jgi:hypothetical protein
MKLAIMQPYFFPYIGYFQLMNAVDEFVMYDNIEFSRKGWVNRNRILVNEKDEYITVPLKKDSDFLDIKDRHVADTWPSDRKKMLNRITESYRKAPHFGSAFLTVERCLLCEETNLFQFLFNSMNLIKEYLGIQTPLVVSSSIRIDHTLKGDKKVMAICKARETTTYINPIGGTELYRKEDFKDLGLELFFLKANHITYPQFNNQFVPSLSIIDVMMFNSKQKIEDLLLQYALMEDNDKRLYV